MRAADQSDRTVASGNYTETPATIRFLRKLAVGATKAKAEQVHLVFNGLDSLTVHFDEKTTHETACSEEQWSQLWGALLVRGRAWNRVLGPTTTDLPERVIGVPLSATAIALMQWQSPSDREVVLSKVRTVQREWVLEQLDLPGYCQEGFHLDESHERGITVANFVDDCQRIDGFSIALVLLPDALAVVNPYEALDVRRAIERSNDSPVLIGVPESDDPIEIVFDTASRLGTDQGSVILFFDAVRRSLVAESLRRVCSVGGSERPLAVESFSSLPQALRPKEDWTERFCPGCAACADEAKHKHTILASYCTFDARLRALISDRGTPSQLTERVYRSGSRSLLQHGLDRVRAHSVTLMELLATVRRISPGFLSAISWRTGTEDSPAEELLQVELDSVGNDLFIDAPGEAPEEVLALEPEPEPIPLDEPEPTPEPVSTAKRTLLLVEDDHDQREILSSIFETEGYNVISAVNGKEALEVLASNETQLVVCDLMMPVMNGEEFVKSLRSSREHVNLPVLMLTAIENDDTEFNLLAAGADDYCTKGTKKKVILKRIERLLRRSQNPLANFLVD